MALRLNAVFWWFFSIAVCILAATALAAHPSATPGPPKKGHVLLLYSNVLGLPAHRKNSDAFLTVMEKAGVPLTNVHYEYLDLVRKSAPEYRAHLPQWLREKYQGISLDAIVTVDGAAAQFILNDGRNLFPKVPVISVLSPKKLSEPVPGMQVIQILATGDFAGTLEKALKLYPKTRSVFVVVGASEDEKNWMESARQEFKPWENNIKFEYSHTYSIENLKNKVSSLPQDSLVFYISFYKDINGQAFVPRDVANSIMSLCHRPILGIYDGLLGLGILGGSLFSYEAEGERAGNLVLNFMEGVIPWKESLTTLTSIHKWMFDWNQFSRWSLDEALIPSKSVIINHPQTIWEQYRNLVLAAIAVGLIQLGLIIALLVEKRLKRAAQKTLQNSEERFRVLVEEAPDAIVVVDIDSFRFIQANKEALLLYGADLETLLKSSPQQFYPEGQPDGLPVSESFQLYLKQALAGLCPRFERIVRDAKGQDHFCEVHLVLLPSAAKRLIRASFLDITQRREVESELSLTRFSMEHSSDGLYLMKRDATLKLVNLAACKTLGYTREELMNMNLQDIEPNFSQKLWEKHWQDLRTVGGIVFETVHKHRNGKDVMVEISSNYICYGGIEYDLAFSRDITARKILEERLRQSEKMEAIGRLAGGIAHDFNNQLASIMGYADMLVARENDTKLNRFAQNILKSTQRAAELTKNLLAFSRKGKFLAVPVNICEVIDEVFSLLSHSLDKKIELIQSFSSLDRMVLGDSTLLQNAFLNLAINARDAMPNGGSITFATALVNLDKNDDILELSAGKYLEICVADTGFGMTEEVRAQVFEPFFTTKEIGKGTGLGLAAVYGMIKDHQGSISVKSQIGKGTTFRVLLPLLEQSLAREDVVESEVQGLESGRCLRFLVIDDEESVRNMIVDMLQIDGHNVNTFSSGESAVEFYQTHWQEVDFVICDMIMPKMSGRETFSAMQKLNPEIKMLLASGFSVDGDAQGALDEGVLGFLQKPFQIAELKGKIAEAWVKSTVKT